MARFHSHSQRGLRMFPITVGLLLVFAILPAKWLGWVHPLSQLVVVPTAPVADLASHVVRVFLPAAPKTTDEQATLMQEEIEGYKSLFLRERSENDHLRELIQQLQSGLALSPKLPVRLVAAPVIGTSSDLSSGVLRVRLLQGVRADTSTVATTTGLQLVGRVSASVGPVCLVQPITSKSAGKLRVTIDAGKGQLLPLAANLQPMGDGRLKGDVFVLAESNAAGDPIPEPLPGQLVRLDDTDWPSTSQMLIVGVIESVDAAPDQILRSVITVRPTVDVTRVAEVVLRLNDDSAGSPLR